MINESNFLWAVTMNVIQITILVLLVSHRQREQFTKRAVQVFLSPFFPLISFLLFVTEYNSGNFFKTNPLVLIGLVVFITVWTIWRLTKNKPSNFLPWILSPLLSTAFTFFLFLLFLDFYLLSKNVAYVLRMLLPSNYLVYIFGSLVVAAIIEMITIFILWTKLHFKLIAKR